MSRTKVEQLLMVVLVFSLPVVSGCNGSKTLLYQVNNQIWKEYENGTGKELLVKNGQRPRWIPGTKTHFAYIERKGGTAHVKLWVVQENGKNPVALTGFEVNSEYSWSPDGKWIAVAHSKDGNYEIYKIKVDGSQQVRLTKNSFTDEYPRWSPKGGKIAFESSRSGHQDIYVIDEHGGGEKKLSAPSHIGDDNSPAWSPDGKKIVYVAERGAEPPPSRLPISYLNIVDITTGKTDQITKSGRSFLPRYQDSYILFLSAVLSKYTLNRYDPGPPPKISPLGTYLNYAGGDDPLTSDAAYVYTTRKLTQSGATSIYRTQHYTGDTVDLGPGREPDVW